MTIEEELRDYILSRYSSLKEFSEVANIAHSTLYTILIRGVSNAKVGNIIKICQALNISADALAEGRIESKLDWTNNVLDVKDIVDETKVKLLQAVTLEGKQVDVGIVESLSDALDLGYELSKRKSTNKASEK
jgi:transcriptional regulator with XRE-family HTH domain